MCTKKNTFTIILLIYVFFVFYSFVSAQEKTPPIPTIPEVELRLGLMPFGDHTYQIIGLKQDWYKEVGISVVPKPYGKVALEPEMVSSVNAGTVELGTYNLSVLLGMDAALENLRFIAAMDIFHGFGILAPPNSPYKTYREFVAEGVPPEKAIGSAILQLKGKTLGHDPSLATKGLRDLGLEMAGLKPTDVKELIMDDNKLAELALSGRLEFISPTAGPIVLGLMMKGFKPILTAYDMMTGVKPSRDSKALRTVGQCGIIVHKDWINKKANYETALRAIGVAYRISDMIKKDRQEALKLHLPFVNTLTGQSITQEEGAYLYTEIQTFLNFEDARRFYFDKQDPFYYEYMVESYLTKYIRDKVLSKPRNSYVVDNFYLAKKFYEDLLNYRFETESNMWQVDKLISAGVAAGKDLSKAQELSKKAKYFYESRAYLDSSRFSKAAIDWAKYAMK